MACGASFYEDNPLKDRLRDEKAAEKNLRMAGKIAKFLEERANTAATLKHTSASPHEVTKVRLEVQDAKFTAYHRGFAIAISCDNPAQLSDDFRSWIATDMTHITKIEPRA